MEKKFYVYEHIRLDTGEVFYVGKGSGLRAWDMRHNRNPHHVAIQKKMKKLGLEVSVRLVREEMTESCAFSLERALICAHRALGASLVNMTDGGDGLKNPSPEVRKKMGEANRGHTRSYGRVLSPESKKKIGDAQRGRPMPPHVLEVLVRKNKGNKYCLGKSPGPETRAKMSAAHMGNQYALGAVWTEEMRIAAGNRARGRKMPREAVERIAKLNSKAVRCISDGLEFPSAAAAGKYYGLYNHAKVADVCRGVRKSAAGRNFEYVSRSAS